MSISRTQFEGMQARLARNGAQPTSEGDQELRRATVEPEVKLHREIMDWCDQQWPRWKYIHARTDQRSTIAVGCQDFTIFAPGRVLCIECKKIGGKLSLEQQAWALEMRKLGFEVEMVEKFEEFLMLAMEDNR